MGSTFEAHRPNVLYTVDLKSGEVKVIHRVNTWLGHVQFSPTEPELLMFCHEGPWDLVDRIWTIRIGDGEPRCSTSGPEREIAGHEFWSAPTAGRSGSRTPFRASPAQRPRRQGRRDRRTHPLPQPARGGGGIHQFQSPDGKFFIGDGGGKQRPAPAST